MDELNVQLSKEGCRERQQRLSRALQANGADFAFTADRALVHYLSGYWEPSDLFPVGFLMHREGGRILLAAGNPEPDMEVDEIRKIPAMRLGTLKDQPWKALFLEIPEFRPEAVVAVDFPANGFFPAKGQMDLAPILLELRRAKDPDELELIRRACRITDSLYEAVPGLLEKARTELELYAELQKLATLQAAEVLSRFGNDFQSGSMGGLPRNRPFQEGDLIALDLTVGIRGYRSDACRTFCIGRPSPAQVDAYDKVRSTLMHLERLLEPGLSARELYHIANERLDGYKGFQFPHHLGHGIGLRQHEAPRLNPEWDDILQPGDVFTMEPGLYGRDLHMGVRLENAYYLGPEGIEKLIHSPMEECGR